MSKCKQCSKCMDRGYSDWAGLCLDLCECREPNPAAQFKLRAGANDDADLTDGQVLMRDWYGVAA